MKNDVVQKLEKENIRLNQLANLDELTGALNRRAAEHAIKKTMHRTGALFVCDLDNFKSINDRYGHLTGDQCLIRAVRLLQKLIRSGDILGRIGGDEFVLFLYGVPDETAIKNICSKIESRFNEDKERSEIGFGISVAGTLYKSGDDYAKMFDRADQQLLLIKQNKKKHLVVQEDVKVNWGRDAEYIRRDLTEGNIQPGAFCRSYESFKTIYHFMERSLRRSDRNAALVVISLADANSQMLEPSKNAVLMEKLGELLKRHLRVGDVYTRYSSNQYLVLLIDVDLNKADLATKRVRDSFDKLNCDATLITEGFTFPQRDQC